MLESEIYKYPLKIREMHLDTLGHVNNAMYMVIFEEARWDVLNKNGYGLSYVRKEQIGPIVIESNIKYLKELNHLENIIITYQVTEIISPLRIKIIHEIIKEDHQVACRAEFIMGYMDLKKRKLIRMDKERLKALGVQLVA